MNNYKEYLENLKETMKNKFGWMAIFGAIGFVIRMIYRLFKMLSE